MASAEFSPGNLAPAEGVDRSPLVVALNPTGDERDDLQRVEVLTTELFSRPQAISRCVDPELRDESYFVFDVQFSGTPQEAAQLDHQWHQRLLQMEIADPQRFRLSLRLDS